MDAYDLFKKLGSGARFDLKRFRKDAERLNLVRSAPKVEPNRQRFGTNNNINTVVGKTKAHHHADVKAQSNKIDPNEDADEDDDAEEDDDADEDELSEQSNNEAEVQSDTDESSSTTEDTLESDSSSSASEEDNEEEEVPVESQELQLLGNIRSTGEDITSSKTLARKKRKEKKLSSVQKMAELRQEQINHIRNVHHIHTYGTDIPDPVESFDQLQSDYGLSPRLLQNISSVGYSNPTDIQVQALPVLLQKRDIMACAPTGSGKTAAFILPIVHSLKEPRNEGIRALVLSPTRELAKQTYREFQRLSEGIDFKILYIDKIGSDKNKMKKAAKKTDILVSTPNRLVHLLNQEQSIVPLSSVQWLIVDESDKLFEEGRAGFRDQLATIYKACDGPNLCRGMFSATFAHDVEEWCKMNLNNVIQVYIGARNAATHCIEQSLLFCGTEQGKLVAIRDLIRKGIQPPVLVFVQSKERAKELFQELIYDGMNVDVIHADRTQIQRDNVIKSFRSGKVWILICTDLMGRGIDFKGVNLVINYDFPNSAISYIHRIGRTGRAGRSGQAITYFTENDAVNLRSIANVMRAAGCLVPEYMLKINKPNKKDRRKLAKTVPKRSKISTVTRYDLQKAKQKRRIIREGKAKKLRDQMKQDGVDVNQESSEAGKRKLDTADGKKKFKKRKMENSLNDSGQFKKQKSGESQVKRVFKNNKHGGQSQPRKGHSKGSTGSVKKGKAFKKDMHGS